MTGTLLGIRFADVPDAPVWHPDVRAFDVWEAAGGEPFARFYLDLFPRPGKCQGAMEDTVRPGRRLPDGSWQQPVAVLFANLTRPAGGRPSLLRHAELTVLFHEFGHVLHDVLARAEHLRYAGTETELDFVEAPSQMLEHWCWEPAVLAGFARHYRTGEPMPDELLAGLIAARTAASGVLTLHSYPAQRSISPTIRPDTGVTAPPRSPRSTPSTASVTWRGPTRPRSYAGGHGHPADG